MLGTNRLAAAAAVSAAILASTVATAQRGTTPRLVVSGPQGQGAGGMGYRYVSPWSGSLRWLSVDSVKKDLELVDEQLEKIDQIRTELQQEMRDLYKQLRDVPQQERQQRYRELNEALAEKTEKQIEEVLLPEQRERLKQIALQMRLRSYYGIAHVLTSDELAKALGITERQKERLREAQQEVQQEVQQKLREFYAKMREEAERKILGVLSKSQRDKLKKMMGEQFEYQPSGTRQDGQRR